MAKCIFRREAARGNFWLFAPFWGEFGPFLTFNNVNNSKHWPTLNNVKEFCQCYANIQTQTQRSAALRHRLPQVAMRGLGIAFTVARQGRMSGDGEARLRCPDHV